MAHELNSTNAFDVDSTLQRLTMGQKVKLLSGLDRWHTYPIPEAGVPSVRVSDGPNGIRGTRAFNGVPASCFPCGLGLGSTFDIDLVREIGEVLGDECRSKSAHVLLGPTVNTQRSPLSGRSFESFSEDPHLSGTLAAVYINAVKSKGVAATIKHFVANEQEYHRYSYSSDVSERSLREIYLKPFQIVIKKSAPRVLMTAYNRLNGIHASENAWLIDQVLRKEWGYQGMIVSDWTGTYSTVEAIKAGLDLEMPGPTVMRGKAVERALVSEKLLPGDIDARVRKILELVAYAHASGIPFNGPQTAVDTPALRALLRRAAADAIVLLKNAAGLLPLTQPLAKIAVIGPNAKNVFLSGGGSARLRETYHVSVLDGIRAAVPAAEVAYAVGATSHQYLPLLDDYMHVDGRAGALLEFWNEEPGVGWVESLAEGSQPVWSTPTQTSNCYFMDGIYTTTFVPDESGDFEVGVSLGGTGSVFANGTRILDLTHAPPAPNAAFENATADHRAVVRGLVAGTPVALEVRWDARVYVTLSGRYTTRGGLRIGAARVLGEEEAIEEAVQIAEAADGALMLVWLAIVVVGLNHEWERSGLDRPGISLPGAANALVAAVLRANPKTIVVNQSGAPVAMPWIADADTVVHAFYGGNELGNGLADVLFGAVNPSGKLAITFPKRDEDIPAYPLWGANTESVGHVPYHEGIYVGYRGYDKKAIDPLFPFGHGLSYTTFTYSDLSTTPIAADGTFTVSFTITNTGSIDGREVAQVYIADPVSALPRALKELKGFVKVALRAGESRAVEVALDREALGFFDVRRGAWVAEAGTFEVLVGASSRDIRLTGKAELEKEFSWVGL
ncbi:glycoside hydrolase family 3 protein [Auriscalpium vulgare]|uniref:Glycoside hydrolase family 3 protein n=1 Tax=Auriscalpium vulgare TaxID=40419 RepID=A0ACB8RTT5_9AGAM|nr:glycoside hydrolase family 3 protein [Auriscalpium vulgare]